MRLLAFTLALSVLLQSPVRWIVDAGHGGADGGAVAGTIIESGINLDIALKLEAILGLCGESCVLTRSTDEINYPEYADTLRKKKSFDSNSRVKLIAGTDNGVLVSIHQNKFSQSRVSGAQVFYAKSDGSRELAEKVQYALEQTLGADNTKQAAKIPDTVYIMRTAKCPAILIECGYISNPLEAQRLQTEAYQMKLAVAIALGLVQ
ncbi:MAG: N-acetylmuramoyl-L-alanine amidase [Oscillospiraceae bacterium]|jgi:N-acetylmuramoyl-L-alanine amidase|nr:N-acetylmuramoyl-L-alanine amidase [Oscillospiraceae bacterium]